LTGDDIYDKRKSGRRKLRKELPNALERGEPAATPKAGKGVVKLKGNKQGMKATSRTHERRGGRQGTTGKGDPWSKSRRTRRGSKPPVGKTREKEKKEICISGGGKKHGTGQLTPGQAFSHKTYEGERGEKNKLSAK